MDVFHVVYKVIYAPPPKLLVLHLNDALHKVRKANIAGFPIAMCGKTITREWKKFLLDQISSFYPFCTHI